MSETRLKTAVLGLNDRGMALLQAACQSEFFSVVAIADKDAKLAEKTAAKYNCIAFDDYRQLIMQNQLDCLLVAAGMYSCEEYIRMAIKKKFNIFKIAPPTRNFEESAQFVQMAKDEKIKFAIANPGRFADKFTAMQQLLQGGKIEQISLITAFCNFSGKDIPDWQTDLKFSGGGVLLRNCYDILDQIVCNFGVPEQIYSLTSNHALDMKQRLYRTEDIAVVSMKFSDTLIGNLIASRISGVKEEILKIHGKDKILTVTESGMTVHDTISQETEKFEYNDDEISCLGRQLENFALSIISPDNNKLCSSANENLKNMSVIESAYLSARTAMPEEPQKLLRMSEFQPRLIWPVG